MSAPKHTPGPWSIEVSVPPDMENSKLRVYWIIGGDGAEIASILADHEPADAALIAAAPDVVSALEAVCAQLVVQMEWIDNHDASFRDDGEYMGDASLAREALAEARAALTKAHAASPDKAGQDGSK